MKIGNVELKNNIFLAPMAGVTDMPFRILCKEQECGLVYTEMVSAKGMHYDDDKSNKLTLMHEIEKPGAVQIFGSDPTIMAEVTEKLNASDAAIIDINMGCPAPKITKNGEGSALMKNPQLIAEIIRAVAAASQKPVTVKIRKGWDESLINAVEIARIAEENGASAVAVHGRTREQYYSGKADWDIIRRVKEAVSIPVIGNGDVTGPKEARKLLEETKCDAIMVGRGAQGNPWIFKKIVRFLEDGTIVPDPSPEEKIDTIIRHMNMLIDLKGERTGILEMRSHIAWYIKGMRDAAYTKQKIFQMTDKEEIISLLKSFLMRQ
ncbi:TIM-barrel protein, nifR3 family [Ruminiclostridium papyrosolvens DSM 2782]|uniref:tRNA-dihydrouridine synthase n=1 Tax=Ruminiclostridium papyrosolvens DSM 2782 TaxID=588581 RepID=F1TGQ2_9FIRM|nr:tRNA dihydrouridine synthase DusB [Ruminiclostridium papyrosolvens]EGD46383.1 TIM-barrel protein, nifR3 family [Ruminiclostridium papyrosolvens DSM 2782]WES34004.1 tRNA dihydrouridine synthase DusB [Ruminiclostridium papyrosolvens DSM 2782]